MMLATTADVEQRLGRELAEDEITRVDGLLEEASELVTAECRPLPTPTPTAVRIVTSRIVARVLTGPTDMTGVESTQVSAGSFQLSRNFNSDGVSGGPWLSKTDRKMLRGWRRGVVNVGTW